MALEVKNKTEIVDNSIKFNSFADELRDTNWDFKWVTQDLDGNDQTETGGTVDGNKANYPVGTIFFDSKPVSITFTTTLGNVYIDTTPPEFVSENVQYMVFQSDYKCSFTFKSDTPIDVAQLVISCGDILFSSLRKSGVENSGYIKDISVKKNDDNYTVSFKIDKSFDVDTLNENQLTIIVWDISGNYASYATNNTWIYFENNVDNASVSQLEIEFVDYSPNNMMITSDTSDEIVVKVMNHNQFLWEIPPTIQVNTGVIKNFVYDKTTGILTFTIKGIDKEYISVEAWISVNNKSLYKKIKDETYNKKEIGPFIKCDDCRKYHFDTYSTKALKDEHYGQFIMYCQDMMNSCEYSLDTGNRISILEKIARINDFNDLDKVETPYLENERLQFNYEVTPNLQEYLYYMKNLSVSGGQAE